MVNQQLLDYIKQQLGQNVSKEQIKSSLLSNGWEAADIEQGFNAIFPQASTISSVPQQTINTPKSTHKNIKIFSIIFILILLGAIGGVVYAYYTGAFVSLSVLFPNLSTVLDLPLAPLMILLLLLTIRGSKFYQQLESISRRHVFRQSHTNHEGIV